jgi:hypothetical protein
MVSNRTTVCYRKGGDIYVLSTDGSNEAKITTHQRSRQIRIPVGRLMVRGSCLRAVSMRMLSVRTGPVKQTAKPGVRQNATWSPDGQKVVFQLPGSLGIMNVDGTLFSQMLLNVPGLGPSILDPDWQPVPTGLPRYHLPRASPTVFTISGHIDPTSNTSGTYLHLTGTRSGERGIDANGNYSFVNLPPGGDYTVTTENGLVFFARPVARIQILAQTKLALTSSLPGMSHCQLLVVWQIKWEQPCH